MTKTDLAGAIGEAMDGGDIDRQKGEALLALLALEHPLTSGENVGAIDWTKLLQTIQTLLPIIVQLLPVILALFAPRPATTTTAPSTTPVLDVIKNISVK